MLTYADQVVCHEQCLIPYSYETENGFNLTSAYQSISIDLKILSWLESHCLGHPQSTHSVFIVDKRPVATATFDKVVESLCAPVCFCVRQNGEEGSAIHPGAHVTLEGKQCTLNHLWCRMGYLNFQPDIDWCFLSLCMPIYLFP